MLTSILLLLGVSVMMFTISPVLAVVALTTVPVSIYAMKVIAAALDRASSLNGRTPGR